MGFVEHFALNFLIGKEVALKEHDVMVANITLFCTVMVHTKEIYKLERPMDGRLMQKRLGQGAFMISYKSCHFLTLQETNGKFSAPCHLHNRQM
jgi:hypothetical protein